MQTQLESAAHELNVARTLLGHVRGHPGTPMTTVQSMVDLVGIVLDGAERMVDEERTSPADIDEAFDALDQLMVEMEEARSELGVDEYREDVIDRARTSICPGFWPFC